MPDTIFALSSGRPPAAIAVIRISGPQAHQAASALAGDLPPVRMAAVRELRDPDSGELLDEALVLRFDGPATATGEDVVEFQCHGGRAVVDAVLRALHGREGLREAQPGEFTRRAFHNGRIDLTEAEGLADLLEAETEAQRKSALAVAEGGLRQQIDRWREALVSLSAQAERAIDYDEDDHALDPTLVRQAGILAGELEEWLSRPRAELLKDGVLVVIAGPPNSGKSSLINRLAGEERAIVTDVPGTTRDHIEISLSLNGLPIRLTDTAGLRATDDPVETIGVERAERLASLSDVLVWLGEPARAPQHRRMILVHAKSDIRGKAPEGSIAVSSKSGDGVANLLRVLGDHVRAILPDEGAIALNRRQAQSVEAAAAALRHAAGESELILLAEDVRAAREAMDRLTGRAGVEDMLDSLFGRFCLGK